MVKVKKNLPMITNGYNTSTNLKSISPIFPFFAQ